jgi:hypothetical protein
MTTEDFFWLVGLLEGEGSFCKPSPSMNKNCSYITIQMTDLDVMQKVAGLLGASCHNGSKPKKSHWKPVYIVRLKGKRAVELMIQMRPYMSVRRQSQIDAAVSAYTVPQRRLGYDDIQDIIRRGATNETQASIAKDYGLDRTTVSYYARGKKLPMWFIEERIERDRGPDGGATGCGPVEGSSNLLIPI